MEREPKRVVGRKLVTSRKDLWDHSNLEHGRQRVDKFEEDFDRGMKGILVMIWVGAILSLVVSVAIIWAIIRVVLHFT